MDVIPSKAMIHFNNLILHLVRNHIIFNNRIGLSTTCDSLWLISNASPPPLTDEARLRLFVPTADLRGFDPLRSTPTMPATLLRLGLRV